MFPLIVDVCQPRQRTPLSVKCLPSLPHSRNPNVVCRTSIGASFTVTVVRRSYRCGASGHHSLGSAHAPATSTNCSFPAGTLKAFAGSAFATMPVVLSTASQTISPTASFLDGLATVTSTASCCFEVDGFTKTSEEYAGPHAVSVGVTRMPDCCDPHSGYAKSWNPWRAKSGGRLNFSRSFIGFVGLAE